MEQQSQSDEISDDSDSSSREDLESDLLAFDKEQADLIRNVNKMGTSNSMSLGGSTMNFLSSSLSPSSARRTQIVADRCQSGQEFSNMRHN